MPDGLQDKKLTSGKSINLKPYFIALKLFSIFPVCNFIF